MIDEIFKKGSEGLFFVLPGKQQDYPSENGYQFGSKT
jgi:hypothetical protein